ncbi:MAG: hypothetical protein WEC12_06770 [Balneolaceae bacterium]
MSSFKKKSVKIILATLLVYSLLVATHEGEFWPFSIYPMFSKAGNPWTRALVVDVTDVSDSSMWKVSDRDNLAGAPVPVRNYGVDQIDFSNFISKTETWDRNRKQALITMFGKEDLLGRRLMIMKVDGRFSDADNVEIKVTPFLMLTADSVLTNPFLSGTEYQRN